MKDNELIEILKEFDKKRVEQLNDNARNLFNAIMDIADERDLLKEENQQLKADYGNKAQVERDLLLLENEQLKKELQKYKSLYENEKDHTDTLKRIIKEVKEYLEGTFEMSTYTKSVYLDEESIKEILDLLKEIQKKNYH